MQPAMAPQQRSGRRVRGGRVPRVPAAVRGDGLDEPERDLRDDGLPAELRAGRVRGDGVGQHGLRHGRPGREAPPPTPILPEAC